MTDESLVKEVAKVICDSWLQEFEHNHNFENNKDSFKRVAQAAIEAYEANKKCDCPCKKDTGGA